MKRRHGASAQQRRAALIDAAIEVAAEQGMAGVTHRAVTERAGLPLATVGYFFDSITDLAVEALRTKVVADTTALKDLAARLAARHSTPAEMARAFAAAAQAPRTDVLAFVEALLHAARNPDVRPAVTEVLEAGRDAVTAATSAAGAPDADAGAYLALVHGYLLHSIAAPDLVDPDALLRGIRGLFIGGLVERGELDAALEIARPRG
ncbi:TetR/AcrR family transcriptional regulator [Microtetraspora malaysiensis]|uniref:TetR/AcrR family transcriptional regulator n=1 Tax=Microtetraspora malaysiensis TaxID=161358 RepID=UPI003D8C45E0